MGVDLKLFAVCASLAKRAYDEASIEGPASTGVLVEVIDGVQYVAFRGTKNVANALTDISVWRKEVMGDNVHAGFASALAGVLEQTMEAIHQRGLPIVVTGHSLGGALAMLFALHLAKLGCAVRAVVTLGQPRVGDGAFAREYDALLGDVSWRVVHEEDPVPRMPHFMWGFRIVTIGGRMLRLAYPVGIYRHAMRLVYLSAFGVLEENPSVFWRLMDDVWWAWQEWRHRRLNLIGDLLACHHVAAYEEALVEVGGEMEVGEKSEG